MSVKRIVPLLLLLVVLPAAPLLAHCDTLSGPVVAAARTALEKRDITPVLKWVQPRYENEVRSAFDRTLAVRTKGADARELADRWFFETLVRVHREGEGEPFTGLKDDAPAIFGQTDAAVASGSLEKVERQVSGDVMGGLRMRFEKMNEAKKHADESVAAGRKYVAAYVDFMHYVERLHGEEAAAEGEHAHH
jgi:hypothetical protein